MDRIRWGRTANGWHAWRDDWADSYSANIAAAPGGYVAKVSDAGGWREWPRDPRGLGRTERACKRWVRRTLARGY